jgi:hypothetical protein
MKQRIDPSVAVRQFGDAFRAAQMRYVQRRVKEGATIYEANAEWFQRLDLPKPGGKKK